MPRRDPQIGDHIIVGGGGLTGAPHDHRTIVPGCFRCELGHDEVLSALTMERDEYREALERIRVCCANGATPEHKIEFIAQVARKALDA